MLDVFVLPAGMEHSNRNATIESFEKLPFPYRIYEVRKLADVVQSKRNNRFYSFFFDVEKIDAGLIKSLGSFLGLDMFDVLVLYKKNSRTGYAEYRPRIFRHSIQLNPNNMQPIVSLGLRTESVLNGWILEHGFESIDKVPDGRLFEVVKSHG